MTQQQLADRVAEYLGRERLTGAYVSMIENGKRPVDKRTLILALAAGLGVSPIDLIGQPYPPTTRVDLDSYAVIPNIREALDGEGDWSMPPRTVTQLGFAADLAMGARMACDWRGFGAHVPPLLAETRQLFADRADERVGRLLVQAAVTAALMLKPAGWIDLAVRLAELADTVAARIGDPVCVAAARFALAQCALSAGSRSRSYRTASAAVDTLVDQFSGLKALRNEGVAWLGMLHLHAALTAASLHQGDDAAAHLRGAEALARQVQGDPWRMEFSGANVGTWAVGVALENGEPELAPVLARQVNVAELRTPQRRARLHLDTGRGWFATGDTDRAVVELLAADDAAPGDLRNRTTAIEIVLQMVRDAPVRGGSEALRELAVRVGVDPFAPEPVI